MIDKLFKPLNYIAIRHREKLWFDLFIPALLAIALTVMLSLLPKPIAYVGKDGLISLVNGILQILSGFYIASMAAVATFQREGMDDKLEGSPVTLKRHLLTRRQFLTYLFGYLAFMSILMYFIGGFVLLTSNNVSYWNTGLYSTFFKFIFVGLYLFIILNILTTTALGMHFLIDKIHRQKAKLLPPQDEE